MSYESTNLTTSLSKLIVSQPFFAVLLTDLMEIQETNAVECLATDGRTIKINPEFFDSHTVDEGVFMLAHEIMHAVFGHSQRGVSWQKQGVGPDFKKFQVSRWNKACDYVVNATLHAAKVGKMPISAYTHPDFTSDMQVDEVYCALPEDPEEEDDNKDGSGDAPPEGFDQHQPPSAGNPTASEKKVERALTQAKDAAKAQGGLDSTLERLVQEITDPKVDWKEVLHNFMVDTMGRDEATWSRCNRRRLAMPPHIPFPGTKGNRSGNLAVVVDTSGSISDDEVAVFLGEVQGIMQQAPPETCSILWTHSVVSKIDEVDEDTDLAQLTPGDSGGTDMEAGCITAAETIPDLDAIIVLTDGHTHFSDNPPVDVPVMWVMTTNKVAPYGKTIQLD